nr:DNA recombination protein RmuC [Maliibacterium massiliense]
MDMTMIISIALLAVALAVLAAALLAARGTRRQLARMQSQLAGQLEKQANSARDDAHFARQESMEALERINKGTLHAIGQMTSLQEQKLEGMRAVLAEGMAQMRADNEKKLDQMRATVDEKLDRTLNQRLGDSFNVVSQRLEQVYKSMGEMQQLATGVGDLKRVLTNVKTRGIWGEMQLASLLEQMLAPGQYASNVAIKPGAGERVEFAVCLPGSQAGQTVYMPIDAKFPVEDYQRVLDAVEQGDPAEVERASKALETTIRQEAKRITKYIVPPYSTDFAVMFLPVEGLYAEVLRREGLMETLQRDCRVTVAGPTTLAALLNSLQVGFRTLAIQQRTSEVWQLLAAIKQEFGRFAGLLEKTQKKLNEASNGLESIGRKSRTIERKLRGVEQIAQQQETLGLPDDAPALAEEQKDDLPLL